MKEFEKAMLKNSIRFKIQNKRDVMLFISNLKNSIQVCLKLQMNFIVSLMSQKIDR